MKVVIPAIQTNCPPNAVVVALPSAKPIFEFKDDTDDDYHEYLMWLAQTEEKETPIKYRIVEAGKWVLLGITILMFGICAYGCGGLIGWLIVKIIPHRPW